MTIHFLGCTVVSRLDDLGFRSVQRESYALTYGHWSKAQARAYLVFPRGLRARAYLVFPRAVPGYPSSYEEARYPKTGARVPTAPMGASWTAVAGGRALLGTRSPTVASNS
jgi:hypothetical protein